ncbi:Uncharacterised protein [Mycobacteroides abscessus subsp. abscessus]|nr:Uncharacterised protein [Mycobacteroides abscessus subsp. abscessus]
MVRAPLPGGLHRGVHRADPRLVLHPAHPGHGPVRPARVQERGLPRHRAGLGRAEDVQVPAQLPGRLRGPGPGRLRCDALVPDVQPHPARGQPHRHRVRHPRGRAPGDAAAVERVPLLHLVHERGLRRGGLRGPAPLHLGPRDGPVHPGPHPPADHGRHRGDGRLRRVERLRAPASLRRRPDQLVRAPFPPALLRRGHRRLRRAVDLPGDGVPGGGTPAAADRGGDVARADRAPLGAPGRLAGRRGLRRGGGSVRAHGHHPGRVLGRFGAAQGPPAARAPAPGLPHRRRPAGGRSGGDLRGHHRLRAEHQDGDRAGRRADLSRGLRHLPQPEGQRPGRRTPAGSARAAGHPRCEGGGLADRWRRGRGGLRDPRGAPGPAAR